MGPSCHWISWLSSSLESILQWQPINMYKFGVRYVYSMKYLWCSWHFMKNDRLWCMIMEIIGMTIIELSSVVFSETAINSSARLPKQQSPSRPSASGKKSGKCRQKSLGQWGDELKTTGSRRVWARWPTLPMMFNDLRAFVQLYVHIML